MSTIKPEAAKNTEIHDEESAFEMIELACGELDQLTKAFKVIDSVCSELAAELEEESREGEFVMH